MTLDQYFGSKFQVVSFDWRNNRFQDSENSKSRGRGTDTPGLPSSMQQGLTHKNSHNRNSINETTENEYKEYLDEEFEINETDEDQYSESNREDISRANMGATEKAVDVRKKGNAHQKPPSSQSRKQAMSPDRDFKPLET